MDLKCLHRMMSVYLPQPSLAWALAGLCAFALGCTQQPPSHNAEITDTVVRWLSDQNRLHQLPGALGEDGKPVNRDEDIHSIEFSNAPVTSQSI